MLSIRTFALTALALIPFVNGHGSHSDGQSTVDLDWPSRHMIEEHHISSFDDQSFFSLHDYDNSGVWTKEEVRRTYGFDDESNAQVPETSKQKALQEIFAIFDPHNTGVIRAKDYLRLTKQGEKLPDVGLGPGHHGDLEYEYEIHHFEKYHGDDTTAEDLTHPEDVEHFRRHDQEEYEARRLEIVEQMNVVEANIPLKFRRQ